MVVERPLTRRDASIVVRLEDLAECQMSRWLERLCQKAFDEDASGGSFVLMVLAFGAGAIATIVIYMAVEQLESVVGLD